VANIEDAGYSVIQASSADEAIKLLESRSDIRAIFTDVRMPGSMDGERLAKAVRDRWPPIEVIVTSGNNILGKDRLPERGRFIAKPYDDAVLIQMLSELVPIHIAR
jgi:CheY-like chemotaxis protein